MNVLDITTHELVGVSRSGELCSCGVTDESWLEHLGDVAVGLMGVPRVRTQTVAPIATPEKSPDELWIRRQQREFNLASFSKRETARPSRPRHQFTEAQLRIARADFERRRRTA